MREVETFFWYLPPPAYKGPRAKEYLSSWRMSREEAAKRGAIRPDLGSRKVIQKAETPEEEEHLRRAIDTSVQGVACPTDRKPRR